MTGAHGSGVAAFLIVALFWSKHYFRVTITAPVRLGQALPPPYLERLLSFLAREMERSTHLHALLLWVQARHTHVTSHMDMHM